MFKILKSIKEFFSRAHVVLADYNEETEVMTIKWSDGRIEKFVGSCTVWNKLPYMERSNNEGLLYRMYKYNQFHKKPYKNV